MNINSMYAYFPRQPNNPTDEDRHMLESYALTQLGRPEDLEYIKSLLSPPPEITSVAKPGEFKGCKVGVIGGGLAGLAAAFELRKLGIDITIFEADEDRIGGRVYTYYFDHEKTLYGEFGAMRIPVSHETVWHYINLFKIPTRPFIQKNKNTFVYLRGMRARNDPNGTEVMKNIYPKYNFNSWERKTTPQQLIFYGLDSHLLNTHPAIRSEIIQVKPEYNPITLFWNRQNNRQMLELAGLSDDAISMVSDLSPLAGGNLYNSYIDFIQEEYPANLSFLYEIPGGMAVLPYSFFKSFFDKNFQKYYPAFYESQLGTITWKGGNSVTGIYEYRAPGKVSLAYRKINEKQIRYEDFDYIICAVPLSVLRTMEIVPDFSPGKMQAIVEVNYISSQKTIFLCNRRFWEVGGPSERIIGGASYTDLPITQIWYPSDHAQFCFNKTLGVHYGNMSNPVIEPICMDSMLSKQPGVIIASYNYTLDTIRLANLPEHIRVEEIKREIEIVHGLPKGYLDSIVIAAKTVNWDEEPTIRGALCFFANDQKRLYSYEMTIPEYGNRVFFAGEHISATHRWMQGALQSGMQAANGIARECSKKY